MDERQGLSFWRRYQRQAILMGVPLWVILIVIMYRETRAVDTTGTASYVLKVGALPVTCNLTGAIACMSMDMSRMSAEEMAEMADMEGMAEPDVETKDKLGTYTAKFERYSGWPEIKEAIIAGNIGAAYLLAPLAMDLADNGIPLRIVALGHRSGAVIMVPKDSPAQTLADLRGKRLAIPSRFAVDHLFVRRLMKKYGMSDEDLKLIEIAPPDMPAALYAGAVDGYATGEPFGARAEREGYARVLHWTRQDWPTYVCCVLAVRTDLTRNVRPLVQKLVNTVLSAGMWLEKDAANRDKAAEIAARPEFFNQDPSLLKFVLSNPRDRVTYGNLALVRSELEDLMQLGLDAKIINHPIPYETYADETYIRRYTPAEINVN